MIECPRCQQIVDSQAIACPICRTPLKAYGHPGISLHQATTGEYLCPSCVYHHDDTCNFPQRPHAKQCTLYQPPTSPAEPPSQPSLGDRARTWVRHHTRALLWIGLAVICVLIALR